MHSSIFLSVRRVSARYELNLSRMLVCKRVPNVSSCQFNEGTRHLQQRTLRNGVTLSSDSSPYVAQFVMACNIHVRQNYHCLLFLPLFIALLATHHAPLFASLVFVHFLLPVFLGCQPFCYELDQIIKFTLKLKLYLLRCFYDPNEGNLLVFTVCNSRFTSSPSLNNLCRIL